VTPGRALYSPANHDLLLSRHRELDWACRNRGDRVFISDWYCEHPFVDEYLPEYVFERPGGEALANYYFPNDPSDLHDLIARFHRERDGVALDADGVFVGDGTSALLTAQLHMLRERGVREIHYVRPLYYSLYYLARLMAIRLVPVNDAPLHDDGSSLRLPTGDSVLVVCDPIWFMGRGIDPGYVAQVAEWQAHTGNTVLVDGAFQYMQWRGEPAPEPTAQLDPALTFRTLCPTKTVALHGLRFSYVLCPPDAREDLRYAYSNSMGPSSVLSGVTARSVMKILLSPESNGRLLRHIEDRYDLLRGAGLFTDPSEADRTYFVFAKPNLDPDAVIAMDQEFFDLDGYPGHARINLLAPGITGMLDSEGWLTASVR
jgi:aspartate/methionine/tyrosine aminotransferase